MEAGWAPPQLPGPILELTTPGAYGLPFPLYYGDNGTRGGVALMMKKVETYPAFI
jgi:hypothetical protein